MVVPQEAGALIGAAGERLTAAEQKASRFIRDAFFICGERILCTLHA
jgi:hypothetical protein